MVIRSVNCIQSNVCAAAAHTFNEDKTIPFTIMENDNHLCYRPFTTTCCGISGAKKKPMVVADEAWAGPIMAWKAHRTGTRCRTAIERESLCITLLYEWRTL